ncbi:MAG: hypothetical protein K2H41_03340 [Acetatifactor sp.]|nr:hypothetical protein [Acetatifactor sp.]
MILKINLKQIGERKQKIAPVDFEYHPVPKTVRELITQTVTSCVNSYNERVREGENNANPLSEKQVTDMAGIGKIAFGINYGGKEQALDKAIDNALQSFEDGIYRVFLNDNELEKLDEEIDVSENDSLTFIRLTMLAGRMW